MLHGVDGRGEVLCEISFFSRWVEPTTDGGPDVSVRDSPSKDRQAVFWVLG